VRGTWAIIKGQVPIATITAPNILDETVATNGQWQTGFYATNSTDDFGIAKYEWNFGNGTLGTGSTVYPIYSGVGTYLVTLRVTDRSGQTSTATKTVTVKANAKPTAVVVGPRYLDERDATNGLYFGSWTGLSSTDDRGIYRYDWNFGDGSDDQRLHGRPLLQNAGSVRAASDGNGFWQPDYDGDQLRHRNCRCTARGPNHGQHTQPRRGGADFVQRGWFVG